MQGNMRGNFFFFTLGNLRSWEILLASEIRGGKNVPPVHGKFDIRENTAARKKIYMNAAKYRGKF